MGRSKRKQQGGRGGGRGSSDGGRGRGAPSRGGRGRGRGRGGQGYYAATYEDEWDYSTHYPPKDGRYTTPKGRGGGFQSFDGSDSNHSRYQMPVQETAFARGNGFPYGRGGHINSDSSRPEERAPAHRGLGSKVHRGGAPLSRRSYEDRPLLKPIKFVPSKLPSLFLNEDEIFKPMVEEAGEQEASHVPTADRVFQIFHHGDPAPNSSESPSGADLPEIDFKDLGRLMDEMEVLEAKTASSKNATSTTTMAMDEPLMGARIDTNPSPVRDTPANHILVERPGNHILGDDDDEIIVYVAPNPRKGILPSGPIPSSSAAVTAINLPADSEPVSGRVQKGTHDAPFTTASTAEPPILEHLPTPSPPISSPAESSQNATNPVLSKSSRSARRARRPHRVSKRRKKRRVTFSSFGAIQAEIALREVDPRRDEQRRGDSDVDWGVSASDEGAEDGGMQVDGEIDVNVMKAFVKGMGITGSAPVTADDLAEDEEKSDEEGGPASDGSSGEDDEELELADDIPGLLISEDGDFALGDALVDSEESEDECTSDEEEPHGSFQARLERLRKRTEGRPIKDILKDELDGEIDDDDDDDSLIAQIQEILDDNDEVLRGHDRKQKNRIFRAIKHGNFEHEMDFPESPVRRKKNKNKFISEELNEQWERDRKKKAERKRLRELEKAAAALDPFTTKKGGKKARKAREAAAMALPMSLETIVEQMRRFVADLGGARMLPFPPMDRKMRKSVHDLAHAFKLHSKSKNNGSARFTTLAKTRLTGISVDEWAIARVLGTQFSYEGGKGKGKGKDNAVRIRPRDGEVVGEAAPRIDGSNVGFQMLAAMGWEEGGRIGAVGGLEAPLVAVIKTTKLGLGASSRGSGRSKWMT